MNIVPFMKQNNITGLNNWLHITYSCILTALNSTTRKCFISIKRHLFSAFQNSDLDKYLMRLVKCSNFRNPCVKSSTELFLFKKETRPSALREIHTGLFSCLLPFFSFCLVQIVYLAILSLCAQVLLLRKLNSG